MKKIIIILAMVLAGVAMYAQEPQVLVLKDGTVIKGEVEKLPDGGARVTNEYGIQIIYRDRCGSRFSIY